MNRLATLLVLLPGCAHMVQAAKPQSATFQRGFCSLKEDFMGIMSSGSARLTLTTLLTVAALAPATNILIWLATTSLGFLALLGAIAAWTGGTPVAISVWRVSLWGALAMAITSGVGTLFGPVA